MQYEQADIYTDPHMVADPFPYFEWLRAQGPVVRLPHRNVVAITGYEEAVQVYGDAAHFSSLNAVNGPLPDLPFIPAGDDIAALIETHRPEVPFGREVVALDAPHHQPLRSLLMPLFTPGKLKAKAADFLAVADALIDEFAGRGTVEFIGEYANPLATLIIVELLGVPQEDRASFRQYFQGAPAGAVGATVEEIGANPLVEMGRKLATYIAERRHAPQADLLTELALARFPDGSEPTLEEAARVASFLFGAGQDTTVKLLGNAFRLLAETPDLQDRLRAEPGRVPDFVEEMLRYEGSIRSSHRLCKVSTEIGGVAIAAGTTIMIANLAANRDPRRFAHPDQFDMERPRVREHLAFGRGAHTCAGAPLARAETRLSLERILQRLGRFSIDETRHGPADARRHRYEPSYVLRGLEELHLTFR